MDENELNKMSKIVEIKIFPLNYNFDDELKSHGLGILLRGNVEVLQNESSKVLDLGSVTSFSNSSESKKIVSKSPVTMVWISKIVWKSLKKLQQIIKIIFLNISFFLNLLD